MYEFINSTYSGGFKRNGLCVIYSNHTVLTSKLIHLDKECSIHNLKKEIKHLQHETKQHPNRQDLVLKLMTLQKELRNFK